MKSAGGTLTTLLLAPLAALYAADAPSGQSVVAVYERRVESVGQAPGLVAFWDFVQQEDGARGAGRFLAHTEKGDDHRDVLEPHNISRTLWHEGEEATLADFPLLGRGPFGQAVQFREPG